MIALLHRHPARLVRFGAGNFFFKFLSSASSAGGVEFREGDHLLREDGKARRSNLGETATHEETQFFAGVSSITTMPGFIVEIKGA